MAKKFTKKPINEERLKRAEKVTEELHQEKEPALPKVEKKDTKRRVSFNLRMPGHIYDQLSQESERTGMSRASIVYRALAKFFDEK